MSKRLCDRCFQPGACCKGFYLGDTTFWVDEGKKPVRKWLDEKDLTYFLPSYRSQIYTDENGREYAAWNFNCTALQPDGRCGIYRKRPDVCRNFKEASGTLCVHFQGAEGVDLRTLEDMQLISE